MQDGTNIKFFGTVLAKGTLAFYKKDLWNTVKQKLIGKEFEIVIRERFYPVTKDQHAFYRGGIIPTCMETEAFAGMTKDEIHEVFQAKFLSYEKQVSYRKKGAVRKKVQTFTLSTAQLSTKEMNTFIENVLDFLATLDIHPLTPEEYENKKYSNG